MSGITTIADLTPDPKNARLHNPRNVGMIEQALGEVGAARSIVIDENGVVLAGNATIEAAAQAGIERVRVVEADGNEIVAVQRKGLSEEQKLKLALYDNRATDLSGWDASVLAGLGEAVDLSTLFRDDELNSVLGQAADNILASEESDEPQPLAVEAPDLLFSSDNEWGIPALIAHAQPDGIPMPVERWGRRGRGSHMPGTWHFYTEDYKFNALWSDPTSIVFSQCRAIVEPNISTGVGMPRAVALWGIYRKRWLSRWAQQYGIGVFVDLNVEPEFAEINLLGVPRGWRHYATRGYDTRLELLEQDYQTATQHAVGEQVTFLVVGGGQTTRAACLDRGWLHIPQESHEIEGRYSDG